MKKKVILLVSSFFTERDYIRYGIDEMKTHLAVEVWDLTNLLYSNVSKQNSEKHTSKIIRVFGQMANVTDEISLQKKHTYFISSIIVSYKSFKIFKTISKNKYAYGCVGPYQIGLFPSTNPQGSFFSRNGNITLTDIYYKILNRLFINKLSFRILDIKAANHFFMSGGDEVEVFGNHLNDSTELIKIHSNNYDIYLENERVNLREDYILYLDQYFPFHPDFEFSQQKNVFEKNEFYENLRIFFEKIEKIYDLEVVISAHPKSFYEDKPGLFGNRRIIKNINSLSAIIDASLVIVHNSSALDFAVLYNKNMIFLTSSSFENTREGEMISAYAELFNVKTYDCRDSSVDLSPYITTIDSYKSYIQRYIKSKDSEIEKFWVQVINTIKSH